MADESDKHWILCNENPEWQSVRSWRKYVRQHADKTNKHRVDSLSPEALYYIGWNVRRARLTGSREKERL